MAALSRCVRVLGRLSLRGSPAAGGGAMIAARGECWASTVGIERDAGSSSIANARDVTRTWSVLHATRGFARGSDASMRAAGDDAGRKGSGAGDEDPGDPASDAGRPSYPMSRSRPR